jgi:hypothetical protein
MRLFRVLAPLALLATLSGMDLRAQDPALKETFQQAKALWGIQGDNPGASAKFEQILGALEPKGKTLEGEWLQMLCETYNWLAILDDRSATKKPRAQKDLEALLELNPDFDMDRIITNARLQGVFEALRSSRLVRVKLALDPEGGILAVDGRPRQSAALKFLPPGNHKLTYAKTGYQSAEQQVDLSLKEPKSLEMKLTRVSSTVSLCTSPAGIEVLLDGKSLGTSVGIAAPELRPMAEKAGVRLEELSAPFVVGDLPAGRHTLELRAPCFRTRRIELDPSYATPFADHTLEAYKLDASRGLLTVSTAGPGGELLLSGKPYGPVPVKDLQLCSGSYDLQVRFPAGGFTERVEVPDGKSVQVNARPKVRMLYLGCEGSDDFAGRERMLRLLASFGERLKTVAFMLPAKGETPQEALTRIRTTKEAELTLTVRPRSGKPIHEIELVVSTLQGEEDRSVVKPLEQDPLAALAARLNRLPRLWEPWVGLNLLDLPGEIGPWVLRADETALRAGIKTSRAITQVNGKPVTSVMAFRKALAEAPGERIALAQGEAPIQLPVTQQALELPLNASDLCYPFVLAELRLRYLGAKGDEAGLLRLNQALALMHFRLFGPAMEVLRDARMTGTKGVSQGTLDYYTGVCLLRLGNVYADIASQSFNQALKYPQATLFGPEGPFVAPLARQALEDLKP